ncbi:MAG: hypothetical protein ACOYVD_08155 [Bacillota bacterium]
MKKFLLLILMTLYLLFLTAFPLIAEEDPEPLVVKDLILHIMPEYDTSEVLVLYSLEFENVSNEQFMDEIRFGIPTGTRSNIVIESGKKEHLQVRTEVEGDNTEMVWKPSEPIKPKSTYSVHLEYYYNSLPGTGEKSFEYILDPGLPLGQTQINIVQPLKSVDFTSRPASEFIQTNSRGFKVYQLTPGPLNKDEQFSLKISYTKTDPEPSIEAVNGEVDTKGDRSSSLAILLPIFIIFVFLIVIAYKALTNGNMGKGKQRYKLDKNTNNKGKLNLEKTQMAEEKRKLRKKLLDGEITAELYQELLDDIEEDYS